jgi:hypothetical protein
LAEFWPNSAEMESTDRTLHTSPSTSCDVARAAPRPAYKGCYREGTEETRLFSGWYGINIGPTPTTNDERQVTLQTCATAAAAAGSTLFGMQYPMGSKIATTAICFLNMRSGAQLGVGEYTKLADSECQWNGGSIVWDGATYTHFGGAGMNAIYSILDCAAGAYRGGVV